MEGKSQKQSSAELNSNPTLKVPLCCCIVQSQSMHGVYRLWHIHHFPLMCSGRHKFGPLQVHLTFCDIAYLSFGQLTQIQTPQDMMCWKGASDLSGLQSLVQSLELRQNSAFSKHSCFVEVPGPHFRREDLKNTLKKIWPKEQTRLKTTA